MGMDMCMLNAAVAVAVGALHGWLILITLCELLEEWIMDFMSKKHTHTDFIMVFRKRRERERKRHRIHLENTIR